MKWKIYQLNPAVALADKKSGLVNIVVRKT